MKQYFSKLHHVWLDLKTTDCEISLRKYFYEIRLKPTGQQDLFLSR